MSEKQSQITYHWFSFPELSTIELYNVLKLRQQVFVVEQKCPYLDADDMDKDAWHLLAMRTVGGEQPELVACLRLLPPGKKYTGPAIGRLATALKVRGKGIGRELMQKALHFSASHFPGQPTTISAQLYLKKFYEELGFTTISEPYDDDSILHIDMTYQP